mmetsp:Transcript_65775/g.137013  ORF Transcript_65775/g.137013 Transcript_65775/m.137013 type:complete len:176 (-) Transcript_65775:49-576(-)
MQIVGYHPHNPWMYFYDCPDNIVASKPADLVKSTAKDNTSLQGFPLLPHELSLAAEKLDLALLASQKLCIAPFSSKGNSSDRVLELAQMFAHERRHQELILARLWSRRNHLRPDKLVEHLLEFLESHAGHREWTFVLHDLSRPLRACLTKFGMDTNLDDVTSKFERAIQGRLGAM